jgi:signal peptidase I
MTRIQALAQAPETTAPEVSPAETPETSSAHVPKSPHHHTAADVVHGIPEAVASLTRTIVVCLFVLTFLLQPMVIPSESMEHTLLVGDFLLMNRASLGPPGIWKNLLPYDQVKRGDIVTFRSGSNPKELIIKRVIGVPGDRLHIDLGQVFVNGKRLNEPYATFEPTTPDPYLDHFPVGDYDPAVEPGWWNQLRRSTDHGELVVPAGSYFMLGDNRNHSRDSRFWGFVQRSQMVARPLFIYFSLNRSSRYDSPRVPDDKLGSDHSAHWKDFARWDRIFRVVH